ncbi:MAG: DUF433 domain-containing protein [Microcystaceae cyanobacterium]
MPTNLLNNAVTIDNKIQPGKPVLTGTRIPIAIIIGSLAGGMSYEEVMEEYAVTPEQILAVFYDSPLTRSR